MLYKRRTCGICRESGPGTCPISRAGSCGPLTVLARPGSDLNCHKVRVNRSLPSFERQLVNVFLLQIAAVPAGRRGDATRVVFCPDCVVANFA
jgi:hypothetical protein